MRSVALALLVALAGCNDAPAGGRARAEALPGGPRSPEVRTFGALRAIMHEGDRGSHVALGALVPGPHTFAVGALSGLRGEVTVIDDEVFRAYPADSASGARVERGAGGEEATLLVVTRVRRWREVASPADVPFRELDRFVEETAKANGLDVEAPFPVRIEGELRGLRWHVVDGRRVPENGSHDDHVRTAVTGAADRMRARLVGFFSKKHQGVFTHMGSSTHFHVVSDDARATGHVDEVSIPRGARVLLPIE
jgi:alpha-acetolactate decarboxylase